MSTDEDIPFHARRSMPWKYRFEVVRTERFCIEIFDDEVKDWPIPDEEIIRRLKHVKPQATYNIKYSGPALVSTDVERWKDKKNVWRQSEDGK